MNHEGCKFIKDCVVPYVSDHIQGDVKFFNGILQPIIADFFKTDPGKNLLATAITEALKTQTNAVPTAKNQTAATPVAKAASSSGDVASKILSANIKKHYLDKLRKRSPAPTTAPAPPAKIPALPKNDDDYPSSDDPSQAGSYSDSELGRLKAKANPQKKPPTKPSLPTGNLLSTP